MSDKKLIKLITSDVNANFDNQFRNEIIVKKNSEIALHSLSMTREETKITISPDNDTLVFNIGGTDKTIHLKNGRYTVHQLHHLIDNLNKELNSNISHVGAFGSMDFGAYLQAFIDNDPITDNQVFKVRLCRPPFIGLNDSPTGLGPDLTLENVSILNDTLFKSTDAPDDNLNTSFAHYDAPFIRGCGSFRARIQLMADNINPADPNGFIIGLTNKISNLGDDFAQEDINFGIKITSTTSNYIKIINGVETDSGTAPLKFDAGTADNTHDYLDIKANGGRLEGKVFQDGNTLTVFDEPFVYTDNSFQDMNHPNNESLYPVIIFFQGNSRVILDGVRCHTAEDQSTDSFNPDARGPAVNISPTNLIPVPIQSGSNCTFTLNFQNNEIRSFFGFDNLNNTSNQNIGGFETGEETFIESGTPFIVLDTSDIYMIEMLNIPLDSYEGYTEQRKNILAVIPVNENNVNMSMGTLQYESPNLNYISIKNDYDISLRNIKARVVNSRFEPIDTDGTSHITLFIRSV